MTFVPTTGAPQAMTMKPSECSNKKGLAFDFPDGDDLDELALGMSWWSVRELHLFVSAVCIAPYLLWGPEIATKTMINLVLRTVYEQREGPAARVGD